MKLKLAGIALKGPKNGKETKVTHRRVEISRLYSISFPYFEPVTYDRYILTISSYIYVVTQCHIIMFAAPKKLALPVQKFAKMPRASVLWKKNS